ncbi:hypothetical protein CC85DRAFT_286328 [Cutaneotrichosporon oleaginosum]|uniref:BTB domain-containing protein n=1 Tax=Cutaneotrichosporon oleaginosum TaxID=879819 RepID=A0A0J0XKG0_9TREE|nr:uncharacterized protein CC85DRAFT_286328 [Cutaneotrichosporon oleaginosum]KLT41552.1 hypothetical protein CC85DRAFT_286328 [Cutaneotrichosporon oleaginosum]TXT09319.1 hypothetical protein COLE_03253 [Cutaneotrichosporon oleaginosum]
MSPMPRCFHPEFAYPRENDAHPVILQSSDDIYFHFDLLLLASKSEFFEGMLEIPSCCADTAHIVPFTNASAPALAFILHALTWVPKKEIVPFHVPIVHPGRAYYAASQIVTPTTHLLPTAPATPPPASPSPAEFSDVAVPSECQVNGEISPSSRNKDTASQRIPAPPSGMMHASPGDFELIIMEQIIDTTNCYELRGPLDALYATLVRYRWPASIMFTLAVLLKRGNAQYWSQKLLGPGPQCLHPWAVYRLQQHAPKVYEALLNLFVRWAGTFTHFMKIAWRSFIVDGNRDFGRRCKGTAKRTIADTRVGAENSAPCRVFTAYGGDFHMFLRAFLEEIFSFAAESPGLVGTYGALQRFCADRVPCDICAYRVAASVRSAWNHSMRHSDWSLETKHGVQGPWDGGRLWRKGGRRPLKQHICSNCG